MKSTKTPQKLTCLKQLTGTALKFVSLRYGIDQENDPSRSTVHSGGGRYVGEASDSGGTADG